MQKSSGGLIHLNNFNAESNLATYEHSFLTPTHFIRGRVPPAEIELDDYKLTVSGQTRKKLVLTYDELMKLPSKEVVATMECAGNGRSEMKDKEGRNPPGEQWGRFAVSTATWTGIPLSILLKEAGLCDSAVEILFEGSDIGHIDDSGNQISFERSLPREKALDDVILAYKMNDHILPSEHGFPLRLVVPGWYGMAWTRSVKRIEAIDYNFNGFYQKERYVYVKENCEVKPVTTMHVNSVITSAKLDASKGSHLLRGRAWSGEGKGYIVEVHVSIDGGLHWSPAQLIGPNERYAWRSWQYHHILKPGEHTISCMAIDSEGNMQPQEVEYNKFGYGNNAVQRLSLLVE